MNDTVPASRSALVTCFGAVNFALGWITLVVSACMAVYSVIAMEGTDPVKVGLYSALALGGLSSVMSGRALLRRYRKAFWPTVFAGSMWTGVLVVNSLNYLRVGHWEEESAIFTIIGVPCGILCCLIVQLRKIEFVYFPEDDLVEDLED